MKAHTRYFLHLRWQKIPISTEHPSNRPTTVYNDKLKPYYPPPLPPQQLPTPQIPPYTLPMVKSIQPLQQLLTLQSLSLAHLHPRPPIATFTRSSPPTSRPNSPASSTSTSPTNPSTNKHPPHEVSTSILPAAKQELTPSKIGPQKIPPGKIGWLGSLMNPNCMRDNDHDFSCIYII